MKPALTPEDWAHVHSVGFPTIHMEVRAAYGTHLLLEGPPCGLRDHANGNSDVHRIAALVLHGQPFGFTWEDVQRCLSEAKEDEAVASFQPHAPKNFRSPWRDLADRIAALLPPRPENPYAPAPEEVTPDDDGLDADELAILEKEEATKEEGYDWPPREGPENP